MLHQQNLTVTVPPGGLNRLEGEMGGELTEAALDMVAAGQGSTITSDATKKPPKKPLIVIIAILIG